MRHPTAPCSAATFGLMPRHEPPVAGEHDRALHGDAQPLELLVVLGQAVVHVDEGAGHVAVDRVGVVARELLVLLAAGRVHGEGRLGEPQLEARRRDHLDPPLLRRREEHVERLDPRVAPPLAEAGQASTRRSPGRRRSRRGAGARSAGAWPPACCSGLGMARKRASRSSPGRGGAGSPGTRGEKRRAAEDRRRRAGERMALLEGFLTAGARRTVDCTRGREARLTGVDPPEP